MRERDRERESERGKVYVKLKERVIEENRDSQSQKGDYPSKRETGKRKACAEESKEKRIEKGSKIKSTKSR